MIPGVGTKEEMKFTRNAAKAVADEVLARRGVRLDYHIGTMIELPRACVVADELAVDAEFFSFGTNDLTQMTFGFSRDDIKGFMPTYLKEKILPIDPFQSIDVKGVGRLIDIAVRHPARKT